MTSSTFGRSVAFSYLSEDKIYPLHNIDMMFHQRPRHLLEKSRLEMTAERNLSPQYQDRQAPFCSAIRQPSCGQRDLY